MLLVTNGDAAVEALASAGIPGPFLPWRDVLHDGPVPPGHTLAELSEVRARFLASYGWGSFAELLTLFRQRDDVLRLAVQGGFGEQPRPLHAFRIRHSLLSASA